MDTEDIFWIVTKFAVYSFIYIFGRFYYDISWFVPLFFTALRDFAKRKHELNKAATQCALKGENRDAVIARLERLDEIPAWVLFPDLERAEWLNLIIKRFWPNLNAIVVKHLMKFEKKLQTSLTSFKFTKVELGNISPRITGIKVYDKNIPDRDLIIDLNISYFGDCELIFSLNGIQGGIKDIEFECAMRVILKPIISDVPRIAAVQIYFLRHPSINFELTSALVMLDMGSAGDLIRSILKEQISKVLVYPNMINIKLCPEAKDFSFKMPTIDGVLKIKIDKVEGISKREIYITINLGNEKKQSGNVKVKFDVAEFDEEFELISYQDGDHKVKIVINDISAEDEQIKEIARKTLVLDDIKLNKSLSGSFNSNSPASFSASLNWLEASSDKTENDLGLVQVYVDSIRSIDSKYRPFIKVIIDSKEIEILSTETKNGLVTFKNHLNFMTENPEEKIIKLKIIDPLSKIELGEFSYKIVDLLLRTNFEQDLQTFPLACNCNSEVILALKLIFLKISKENKTT